MSEDPRRAPFLASMPPEPTPTPIREDIQPTLNVLDLPPSRSRTNGLYTKSLYSRSRVHQSHSLESMQSIASHMAVDFGSLAKAVGVSAASSVLSGYDQGVIASAMLTMKPSLGLSGEQQEISIGSLNIVAAAGGLMASYAAEYLGRKKAIAIANIFFLVGSVLIAVANGFWLVLVGRMLQGLGVGFALVVAPIFTAELVPARYRGMLVSLSDVSTNLGILLGYGAGLAFISLPRDIGWRVMFGVGGVPAIMLFGLIWLVPESPRWLVGVGRHLSAERALNEIFTDAMEAEKQLLAMQQAAGTGSSAPGPSVSEEVDALESAEATAAAAAGGGGADAAAAPNTGWSEVFWARDPVERTMIWRGLAIAFFSQAIGTEAVVYYAPEVLHGAGVTTVRATLLAVIGVGACKLLFLLVGSQLFDRVGRRPMLLVSAAGLAMSLGVLTASCYVGGGTGALAATLAVGGLCLFMGAFSLGFSPLVYVICSELFPNHVRARAMSVALFTTRIIAGVISSSFVTLRRTLTPGGAWLVFIPVALGAFLFVLLFIPETKGRSLEQISRVFREQRQRKLQQRQGKEASAPPPHQQATTPGSCTPHSADSAAPPAPAPAADAPASLGAAPETAPPPPVGVGSAAAVMQMN